MKRRLHFYIAGGILLVGLILGSFLDLEINQFLFSKNNGFGLTLAAFGKLPGYGCLALMGGALISLCLKDQNMKKWLKICLYVLVVLLYGATVYLVGNDVFSVNGFNNPDLNKWLGYLIMAVVLLPVVYCGYLLGKKCENPNMWKVIIVICCIFVVTVLAITVFKAVMDRPRYRIAVHDEFVSFRNWWQPFKDKDAITKAYGIDEEEFKSFPSGHAGAAMLALVTLSYLPLYDKKFQKYQALLFWAAFAYALLIMFSRMLVGAHFMSDVCFGGLIALVCFYIGNEVVVRNFLPKEEIKEVE